VDRLVFLDSEPLGLGQPAGKPKGDACRAWLLSLELASTQVIIPEIIDYEVRRGLVRVGPRPASVGSMGSWADSHYCRSTGLRCSSRPSSGPSSAAPDCQPPTRSRSRSMAMRS